MYKALSPSAVGVNVENLQEAIAAAKQHGFAGVEVNPKELADLVDQQGADVVKGWFDATGIKPAGWALPIEWRAMEETWQEGLGALPHFARAAHAVGCTRTFTWISPASDDRNATENRKFHLQRLKPIAKILSDNGCMLGLEFIGPRTSRDSYKYRFIYRMIEMLDLAKEVGHHTGLLLDAWHWHAAGNDLDDLHRVRGDQVIYVHVNDAPKGVERDNLVDDVRALPGETGVIDIKGFLQTLKSIGYDGPVTPEPFKKDLANLKSDDDRLKAVAQSMDKVFRDAGV